MEIRASRKMTDPVIPPVLPKIRLPSSFNGTSKVLAADWVQTYETTALSASWSDTQLRQYLVIYLEGAPRKWYENEIKDSQFTWDQTKALFLQTFAPIKSTVFPELAVHNRKYNPSFETIQTYYYDKIELCRKFKPLITSAEIVSYVIDGLTENYKPLLTTRTDLTEKNMLTQLLRLQSDMPHVDSITGNVNHVTVDQIRQIVREESGNSSQINQVVQNETTCAQTNVRPNFKSNTKPQVTCQICNLPGHMASLCYRRFLTYNFNPRYPQRYPRPQYHSEVYTVPSVPGTGYSAYDTSVRQTVPTVPTVKYHDKQCQSIAGKVAITDQPIGSFGYCECGSPLNPVEKQISGNDKNIPWK